MQQLLEFVSRHWELVTAFVVVLLLLLANEARERFLGIPKITSQQVTDLMNHQQALVVDLRDAPAYKEGHIVGALNIPYSTLTEHLGKLEKHQQTPIILVCNQGQQSALTGKLLRNKGFTQVTILAGGITSWRNDNLPLVKK